MADIRDVVARPAAGPRQTMGLQTPPPATPGAARREKFVGFVMDEASAATLHRGLAPSFAQGCKIHVTDFRTSLAMLANMTTPEIVLVDVSGEDQPINAIMDLAEVVEAGTTVIAIGETHNVNFYRTVTKGMGVREYLAKPLTPEAVQSNLLPVTRAATDPVPAPRGGRLVAVCGVRGGVGVTTVATNLAWMIGTEMHRHTVLLDADLHTGTAALNLDVKHDKGLCTALETPERVDQLLIERSTQPAAERLHVLAALEALTKDVGYDGRGAPTLMKALGARYNFIVADAGTRLSAFGRDLLFLAHQRIIVIDPSVVAMRNLERMLELPAGPLQSPGVILVLNRAGGPGGLSQSSMEQSHGLRFNVVIPELPKLVAKAARFGEPAAGPRGPFRNAIQKVANAVGARVVDDAVVRPAA